MSTALEISVILLLVLLNGAFAMSELAIVSSRRSRLMALQRQGSAGAEAALSWPTSSQRCLPSVQVGITLVGFFAAPSAASARSTSARAQPHPGIAPWRRDAFTLVVIVITYLA